MKRIFFVITLLILSLNICQAQFFGVSGQYASKADGQFVAEFSYPVFKKKNPLKSFISSGMEYSTYGGAELSGLNIKPIKINTFLGENFFSRTKYTVMFGVDGGYLLNFPHGKKNGIVVTPNFYFDYKLFFVKAGYDFDVINGKNQFFVRAGLGFGMGAIKMIAKTRIW